MDKKDEAVLRKRYLTQLYKNTKEAFDKYECSFPELDADEFILKEMEKELKGSFLPHEKKAIEGLINGFRQSIAEKEKACLKHKYKGKIVSPEFIFLDVKLGAICKAITKEFGKDTLDEIRTACERERLRRILEE